MEDFTDEKLTSFKVSRSLSSLIEISQNLHLGGCYPHIQHFLGVSPVYPSLARRTSNLCQ